MPNWKWVTNGDWACYVRAGKLKPPPYWIGGEPLPGTEGFPVTMVTALEADIYCVLVGARLPTDDEAVAMDAGRPPFLWEWTSDTRGAPSRPVRAVRGGSWSLGASYLRASTRITVDPADRDDVNGFRCASLSPDETSR